MNHYVGLGLDVFYYFLISVLECFQRVITSHNYNPSNVTSD